MFAIKLDWKEVKISLPDMEVWLKANAGTDYCGTSADSHLTVWFETEPSESVIDSVNQYWESMAPGCSEAVRYIPATLIKTTFDDLKAGLVSKSWDQMSIAERKIVTGQMPTREELGI